MKEKVHQHFKILLSTKEEPNSYEYFLIHTPNMVSDEANTAPTKPVEEEELKSAVWNFHLIKC